MKRCFAFLLSVLTLSTFFGCGDAADPTSMTQVLSQALSENSSSTAASLPETISEVPPPVSSSAVAPAASAPSAVHSVVSGSDLPLAQAPLLQGAGLELADWYWIDSFRLLYAVRDVRLNVSPMLRIVLLDRRAGTEQELYTAPWPEHFESVFYNEQVEFIVDDKSLSFKKPDGVKLEEKPAPDNSVLLPLSDAEYLYFNLRISPDDKYFSYERAPRTYTVQGAPAGDLVVVDSIRTDISSHPVSEAGFPFDVRKTPKKLRWIHGTNRILVEAAFPLEATPGAYQNGGCILDAPAGTHAKEFFFPDKDAIVHDAYEDLLLLECPNGESVLMVYNYKTGGQTPVTACKKEDLPPSWTAQFSLNAGEVAVVGMDQNLLPKIYPLYE